MLNEVSIHNTAIVETQEIGQGTKIWAYTHIMKDVSIGTNCNIGDHCFIESGAVIGRDVTIKNNNIIWAGVTLHDGVFVAAGTSFTNDIYPRSPRMAQAFQRYKDSEWFLPTIVQEGASIGAAAVILAGITIHRFAMVGAGAIVTKDIPPYSLVVGNPAAVSGAVCECGQPLKFHNQRAICGQCGRCYSEDKDNIRLTNQTI